MPWYAKLMMPLFVLGAVGGFGEPYFGAEEIVMSRALKRRGFSPGDLLYL